MRNRKKTFKKMNISKSMMIGMLSFLMIISLSKVYASSQYTAQNYNELYEAFKTKSDINIAQDILIENNNEQYLKVSNENTIRLDLNNKTISNGNTAKLLNNRLITVDGGNLEISNGTIDAKGGGETSANGFGAYGGVRIDSGTVTLKNLYLKNYRPYGLNLKILEKGKATINNVKIDSVYGGGIEVAGGSADMTDCSINQKNYFDHTSTAISVSNKGTLNVYSGNYISENYGAYVFNSGGTFNIYGGNFEAKSKPVLKADADLVTYPDSYGYINIYGGTFKGTLSISVDDQLNIYAGVFENTGFTKEKFSQYVDDGSIIYDNDGVFTVAPKATGITLSEEKTVLKVGDTAILESTILPEHTLEELTWSSSDESIVTVDAEGKLVAKKEGKSIITATVGSVNAQCEVYVYNVDYPKVPNVDTSDLVKEVEVGINNEDTKEMLYNMTSKIIDDILNDNLQDESILSLNSIEKFKEAINKGSTFSIDVKMQNLDKNNILADEQSLMNNYIKDLANQNNSVMTIAQYLDIDVSLKGSDGLEYGSIKKTDKEIQFTIVLPEQLKKEGRIYHVVRVHDGKASMLETTLNPNGSLTFYSDQFSKYALVYEDKKSESIPPVLNPASPKTGDKTNLMFYLGFVILSGCLLGYGLKRKKL